MRPVSFISPKTIRKEKKTKPPGQIVYFLVMIGYYLYIYIKHILSWKRKQKYKNRYVFRTDF